jgi:hypothetical protein
MAGAPAPQVDPRVLNMQQRAAVLSNAIEMTQPLQSFTVDPAQQQVFNIQPRNVGILKGFIIEVTATVTNGATTVANRTGFGSANLLRNITFNDLNNNVRVNVPGWYLAMLDSARQGWAYGGAYANNLAMGYGNNWNVNQGPATIAATADASVRHIYYLPLAYSPDDLRGAIYSGVVSAQMNLQLTFNNTPFVGATDPLNAIYSGNAGGGYKAGAGDPVSVQVYQVYLDQIPMMNGAPILPMQDLNTVYELKSTAFTGVAQGQDFPLPYSNFRDFLSTMVLYDNGGVYNTGSDISYLSLVSANTTNLWKVSPEIAALQARQTFMADPPPGLYYFDSRKRPINTLAFGNMAININATTVNANAAVIVGYEAFAQIQSLNSSAASSLSQ